MDHILTIPFAFPGLHRVRCVFTTRLGGASAEPFHGANISLDVGDDASAVLENRRLLKQGHGFDSWVENRQVHGDAIRFDPPATDPSQPAGIEADGLATRDTGRALVAKTADCQPLILAHPAGAVAVLHVGWRGNRMEFPTTGARAFCDHYGLDPGRVMAVRGPSLGPSASEFVHFDAEFGPQFADYHDPATRTVHLWRLTRDQLMAAGLKREHIFSLDLCTHSLPDLFYSYRRDRTTGRQAALVWLA